MNQIQSLKQLAREVKSNELLAQRIQTDPVAAIDTLADQSETWTKDPWIYRWVVSILGLVLLAVVFSSVALMFVSPGRSFTVPEVLVSLGSASVGALAGLLAPSPARQ